MLNFIIGIILVYIGFSIFFSPTFFIMKLFGLLSMYWGFTRLASIVEERSTIRNRKESIFSDDSDRMVFDSKYPFVNILKNELYKKNSATVLGSVLASVSVHIAKVDGRISEEEIDAIKFSITNKIPNVNHDFIRHIVKLNKEHLLDKNIEEIFNSIVGIINYYFRLIDGTYGREKEYYSTLIFTILYEVAIADGNINQLEDLFFTKICNYFLISFEFQDQIKRSAIYNFNVRRSQKRYQSYSNYGQQNNSNLEKEKLDESLKLFNLNSNYTLEELEKAWKKFIVMYHPDKHHNKEPEIYQLMNQKFVEAKEVFDYLKEYLNKK